MSQTKNEISLNFSEFEVYLQLEAAIRTRISKQGKGRILDKKVFLTRVVSVLLWFMPHKDLVW